MNSISKLPPKERKRILVEICQGKNPVFRDENGKLRQLIPKIHNTKK